MSAISPTQHDRQLIISAILISIPAGLTIWYLAGDLSIKHGNLVLTIIAASATIAGLHILHTRRRTEFGQVLTALKAIRNTQFDQHGAADDDGSDNLIHMHKHN